MTPDTLIVLAVVAGAIFFVVRKGVKAVRGTGGCGCGCECGSSQRKDASAPPCCRGRAERRF